MRRGRCAACVQNRCTDPPCSRSSRRVRAALAGAPLTWAAPLPGPRARPSRRGRWDRAAPRECLGNCRRRARLQGMQRPPARQPFTAAARCAFPACSRSHARRADNPTAVLHVRRAFAPRPRSPATAWLAFGSTPSRPAKDPSKATMTICRTPNRRALATQRPSRWLAAKWTPSSSAGRGATTAEEVAAPRPSRVRRSSSPSTSSISSQDTSMAFRVHPKGGPRRVFLACGQPILCTLRPGAPRPLRGNEVTARSAHRAPCAPRASLDAVARPSRCAGQRFPRGRERGAKRAVPSTSASVAGAPAARCRLPIGQSLAHAIGCHRLVA